MTRLGTHFSGNVTGRSSMHLRPWIGHALHLLDLSRSFSGPLSAPPALLSPGALVPAPGAPAPAPGPSRGRDK